MTNKSKEDQEFCDDINKGCLQIFGLVAITIVLILILFSINYCSNEIK